MPLAAVVTDKRWYAIDVYEKRGEALVKLFTKGPFKSTEESALDVLRQTTTENLWRTIVGHRYDDRLQRWIRWQ